MPRRPVVLELKKGNMTLRIYDPELALRIVAEFMEVPIIPQEVPREVPREPRRTKAVMKVPRRTKVVQPLVPAEVITEIDESLPSYVQGNPWVKVIYNKGKEG